MEAHSQGPLEMMMMMISMYTAMAKPTVGVTSKNTVRALLMLLAVGRFSAANSKKASPG